MNLIMKCAHLLAILALGLSLAVPGLADDGDGAAGCELVLLPGGGEVAVCEEFVFLLEQMDERVCRRKFVS